MANKLIIALVNANPEKLIEVSLPILQATVAASMEYDVEIILSGKAGKIAINGFAQTITDNTPETDEADIEDKKTLHDYIKDAYDAGVLFKVCTTTLELWGDDLIPEIKEIVGGTHLITEAMDSDTVTFTY
jgi:predicted peroxiredoxin